MNTKTSNTNKQRNKGKVSFYKPLFISYHFDKNFNNMDEKVPASCSSRISLN